VEPISELQKSIAELSRTCYTLVMPSSDEGVVVPGGRPVSQGEIWWLQVLRDQAARLSGLISTFLKSAVSLELATVLLGLFMVFYPIFCFVFAWREGLLLLSIPLFLMFCGGLVGLAVAHGWHSR
jgi:hypothetical protein